MTPTRLAFEFTPRHGMRTWYASVGPRQYVLNELDGCIAVSQFVSGQKQHRRREVFHGITWDAAKAVAEEWESEVGR